MNNISLTFKIETPYNPSDHGVTDPLSTAIYAGLVSTPEHEYVGVIEAGFYNEVQMYTELQLKMNEAVTTYLLAFFTNTPMYNFAVPLFKNIGGYRRFVVTYNQVGQKLWFGNIADQFTLTNDSEFYLKEEINNDRCARRNSLPQFVDWGLPSFLGFTRKPTESLSAEETLLV